MAEHETDGGVTGLVKTNVLLLDPAPRGIIAGQAKSSAIKLHVDLDTSPTQSIP